MVILDWPWPTLQQGKICIEMIFLWENVEVWIPESLWWEISTLNLAEYLCATLLPNFNTNLQFLVCI